ncbi:endonuclease I family protein [Bacillus massilinigeriensis]|uniref:endonuclease I family protein n=1 Tax=Bacillus mediterraneensis TaxID=1805474 RepID=UPI0008F95EFC|nr:endonuclease [Bacillus mediterraneensis]
MGKILKKFSTLKITEFVDLQKQLDFLRENQKKLREDRENYYDEETDQADIAEYYKKIGGPDWKQTPTFTDLCGLLENTHVNRIPYSVSKDLYLYTWVDLHPDGSLKSVYSGEKKNPEEIIIEDTDYIRQKYAEIQQLIQKEDPAYSNLEAFEWRIKFNAEHIVPQSWFGGTEPMKGDLHHLFTCDPKCNSSRSNFHYADFPEYIPENPDEPIQNNCGVAAESRFEPEHGKGLAARAMLYYFLRYPETVKREFQEDVDIPLLIKWNKENPVSLYEKHRNAAIYQIQGNRNPFIDFPHLAEKITIPI